MTQQPIELILLRQFADHVATPLWITDAAGDLIYYNEPAETILGRRFDESEPMPAAVLAERFATRDLDDQPLPTQRIPLVIALNQRIPAHARLRILGLDGTWRTIEATAIPIIGQGGRLVGAMAAFWENDQP